MNKFVAHILVVDDDDGIRDLVKQYLNDKGVKLFDEIFIVQKKRIYRALLNSSSKEVISFNKVLNKIINEKI